MTRPVNDWMDLRCIDANYKNDLLTALTGVLTQASAALGEAHNNIDDYLAAQDEGRTTYRGKDVGVQISLYQEILNTLPEQLHRLNRIYALVEKTPTCEEATWHRVGERIAAGIPKKASGSLKYGAHEGDEEAPEWREEFDEPEAQLRVMDFADEEDWG